MTAKKKDMASRELEQAEREILMAKYQTALKKGQFINELKNGLGQEMKTNPNKHRKKTFFQKITSFFRGLFTKF